MGDGWWWVVDGWIGGWVDGRGWGGAGGWRYRTWFTKYTMRDRSLLPQSDLMQSSTGMACPSANRYTTRSRILPVGAGGGVGGGRGKRKEGRGDRERGRTDGRGGGGWSERTGTPRVPESGLKLTKYHMEPEGKPPRTGHDAVSDSLVLLETEPTDNTENSAQLGTCMAHHGEHHNHVAHEA